MDLLKLADISCVVGFGFTLGAFAGYIVIRCCNEVADFSVKFVMGLFKGK